MTQLLCASPDVPLDVKAALQHAQAAGRGALGEAWRRRAAFLLLSFYGFDERESFLLVDLA